MILGVKQLELDGRTAAGVPGDQVAELAQDVAAHLDHVLVASLGLQRLHTQNQSAVQ